MFETLLKPSKIVFACGKKPCKTISMAYRSKYSTKHTFQAAVQNTKTIQKMICFSAQRINPEKL
jgi:hypothetical protein